MLSGTCSLLTKKNQKALSLLLFTHHCQGMASTHEQSESKSILTAHLHTMQKKKKKRKGKQLSHFRSNLECSAFDVSNHHASYEDAPWKRADR